MKVSVYPTDRYFLRLIREASDRSRRNRAKALEENGVEASCHFGNVQIRINRLCCIVCEADKNEERDMLNQR